MDRQQEVVPELMNFKYIFLLSCLNMDISFGICFSKMKFCIFGEKILPEGSMSQIFDL